MKFCLLSLDFKAGPEGWALSLILVDPYRCWVDLTCTARGGDVFVDACRSRQRNGRADWTDRAEEIETAARAWVRDETGWLLAACELAAGGPG